MSGGLQGWRDTTLGGPFTVPFHMDRTVQNALRDLIGVEPVAIPWRELSRRDLSSIAAPGCRLLYAVHGADGLLYLGKSQDLRLRLGYLAGGLASGDPRLHAGGARIRTMGVEPAELQVEVYAGDTLYRRHYHLVKRLQPPANRESRLREGRRLLPQPGR